MIGRDQVLAPVLDPFHRPARAAARRGRPAHPRDRARRECRSRRRHGLRTDARSRDRGRACARWRRGSSAAPWRRREAPARRGRVVARDRAARLQRNAGVTPDRKVELDTACGVAKRCGDIAVGFFHDRRLGRTASSNSPGRGWHRGRPAIPRPRRRQDRLHLPPHKGRSRTPPRPARRHSARAAAPESAGDRAPGLRCGSAGNRWAGCPPRRQTSRAATTPGRASAAPHRLSDAAVRMGRAHHAHMQHVRKGDIGRKAAAARHQGPIFSAARNVRDQGPCEVHFARHTISHVRRAGACCPLPLLREG